MRRIFILLNEKSLSFDFKVKGRKCHYIFTCRNQQEIHSILLLPKCWFEICARIRTRIDYSESDLFESSKSKDLLYWIYSAFIRTMLIISHTVILIFHSCNKIIISLTRVNATKTIALLITCGYVVCKSKVWSLKH